MRRKKKRLTRIQFERLIQGDWESHHGDRVRINGPFITTVKPGTKILIITMGKETKSVTNRTWLGIAKELLIGEYGEKAEN